MVCLRNFHVHFAGEFEYEDGTPVDYVNWANGEPNGIGQDGSIQDCVEFTDDAYGKWYDDDCYRGAAYLCKMNKSKCLAIFLGLNGPRVI